MNSLYAVQRPKFTMDWYEDLALDYSCNNHNRGEGRSETLRGQVIIESV